ncbi:50S ribosomal protein L22 [Candidatus Uhrbacteria bacterium]|nr:50S ribosomal protein L22 [Candidatus Uhrbacteria bacterium]
MIAKARYIRMSPRKVRLIADAIRGKRVDAAETQLLFMRKAAALPVLRAIRSAVANATDQYDAARDHLLIEKISVDGGPMLKRWRPRAFGRAAPIHSRSAHVTVVLKSDKALTRRATRDAVAPTVATEAPAHAAVSAQETEATQARSDHEHTPTISDPRRVGKRHDPEQNRPAPKKSKGFLKTLFSRKTG